MANPVNKRYFGQGEGKIQIHSWNRPGTNSSPGAYIVKQKSKNLFTVRVPTVGDPVDAAGDPHREELEIDLRLIDTTTTVVPKGNPVIEGDSVPEPYGVFNIVAKDDDGSVAPVTRLYNNTVRLNDDGFEKEPWSKSQDDAHLVSEISGVTKQTGGDTLIQVNCSNEHFLETGDIVTITEVTGAVEANGTHTITVIFDTGFTIDGTGSTSLTTYSGGGKVTKEGRSGDEGYAYMSLQ